MKKKPTRLQDMKFTRKMQKKLAVLFILVMLALVGLNLRLMIINKEDGEKYKKQVLSQQSYDSRIIPAQRGDIVDCKGTILATSEEVYNIILDAKVMNSQKGKYVEPTIKALKACFEVEEAEIRKHLTERPDAQYYILAKQVPYEQVQQFEGMKTNEEDENSTKIKGVWFEKEYKRKYPYGALACDLLGFTLGTGTQGYFGIEEYYNDTLNGVNGREYGYLNDDSNLERTIKMPVNGNTIMATIDTNIQNIVEKHILAFNEEHRDEARDGAGSINTAVIIANPNNGEVLAMASYPNFDLNSPKAIPDLEYEIPEPDTSESSGEEEPDKEDKKEEESEESPEEGTEEAPSSSESSEQSQKPNTSVSQQVLSQAQEIAAEADEQAEEAQPQVNPQDERMKAEEEAKLQAMNERWKNFCLTETFEPGSTTKPLTVATALDTGKLTGNEHFDCNGYEEVGGYTIKCVKKYGHGDQTLAEAISNSCNDALMQVGAIVGISDFAKYQNIFSIGVKSGIDLPGEANGIIYTGDRMGPTDLATNSFGQNFTVNMSQMVASYSSVINGGYYYKPHVVKKIVSANGGTIENIGSTLLKQTISAETSDKIKQYLYETVAIGTGKSARVAGYAMGGKTGTAERLGRDKTNYVISFIGHAPADNPQVVCYVVIDRPNISPQSQSKYATKLFKEIMTEVLPYMNIFPTEEYTEAELAELAEKQPQKPEGEDTQEAEAGEEEASGESEGEEEKPEDPYYDPETGDTLDPDFSVFGGPVTETEDTEEGGRGQ